MKINSACFIFFISTSLAGCLATATGPGGPASSTADKEARVEATSAASRESAENTAEDINRARLAWGFASSATLDNYLNRLLDRIKEATPGGPTHPRVYVIPAPHPEAQTTAAGNIYVSIGWIRSFQSEDEVIALLAHEYAHVLFKHHGSDAVGDIGTNTRSLYILASLSKNIAPGITGDLLLSAWDQLAHPTWKRDQEREADIFALDTSMKLKLSYADGVKAFLEHVREWEAKVAVSAGEDNAAPLALSDTHPRAEERLSSIQSYLVEKHPGRKRVKPRKAELQAIMGAGDVKALLASHKAISEARASIDKGKFADAARQAQGGVPANGKAQSWAVTTLAESLIRAGQTTQAVAVLKQAVADPEPNPQAAILLSRIYLANNQPSDAVKTIDDMFERMNKTIAMYPYIIAVYREASDRLTADPIASVKLAYQKVGLTGQCVVYPAYKDACIFAGMSEADKLAHQEKQKQRQKKMEERIERGVSKLFR